jgi:hypothetical protein
MDYWSDGVMDYWIVGLVEFWSVVCSDPILHHSITPLLH